MALLDGIGIGIEFDVLDHVNADTFNRTGVALSDKDLARVRSSRSLLFGAVGRPGVSHQYARGVLLRLRFDFDLYVNHRPARLPHERLSPLRDVDRRTIDCVIVRENTEGLYAGVGGALRANTDHEVAVDVDMTTYAGVTRILEYAVASARREVCVVDKANAVPSGGELWRRCAAEQELAHPDVRFSHLYVDAAAMALVLDPARFDVLVTNNLFGDILSDLAAVLAGGIGAAPSANINPGSGFGLYEPVHGSAPDLAGTGTANPIGAMLSAALMIEHLGYRAEADGIRAAVDTAVAASRCTPDLGGSLSTAQAGAAVRALL
jgi:3-isopropylmalate dehydrogenase